VSTEASRVPPSLRLLIADDHPIFRMGLATLFERASYAVTEASNTDEALALAGNGFDVLITDVVMPPAGGPALVRAVRQATPRARILALSMLDEPVRVAEMLREGATGFALKSQPIEEIFEAVRCVAGDVTYLAPALRIDEVKALTASKALPLERLTARERSVFDLLVSGSTNANVATILQIARSTVEAHRRHIMQKLGAFSIVDLLRIARRSGLVGAGNT
jgi:DNA-binding NarL/FixJ family response regulator